MINNKIILFSSLSELTSRIVGELEHCIQSSHLGTCKVALSGGSTPKAIFSEIAKVYSDSINWRGLEFFWADERCVPESSPESNHGEAKRLLFNYVNSPIYPINGETNPAAEALRYSRLLADKLPINNGYPTFNLILLGLGTDGHTASIFPNQLHLLDVAEPCAVAVHPARGQERITLTGLTLLNAKKIIFIATGDNKRGILAEVLGQRGGYRNYPAWHISSAHANCLWFLDQEAGGFALPS